MKIMFFAHDPGGANAIAPLIQVLQQKHEVEVYAKGSALNILPNAQLYSKSLAEIKPDLIITGTSASDFTEKYLWEEAKQLNIKSIAILDHWANYGIRFSKWTSGQKEHFNKQCDYLPDYIIVMDEFAKQEMSNDGVPEHIILPLGNPHFENIFKNLNSVKDIRHQFGQNKLITYASEPITEDYGSGDEKNIAQALVQYIQGKDINLVIRLHPREDISKYQDFASEQVILDKKTPAAELIKASDLVVSRTSMFLIEAIFQNKPCISYQPSAKDKNTFILTRKNELLFINQEQDFYDEITNCLYNDKKFQYKLNLNTNIIDNIIQFIEGNLWQN